MVVGLTAPGSLATEQRHDLVRAQARHGTAGRSVAQPPDQALPPGLRSLRTHDLQRAVDVDDLERQAVIAR
jgi:hypothetical protein